MKTLISKMSMSSIFFSIQLSAGTFGISIQERRILYGLLWERGLDISY